MRKKTEDVREVSFFHRFCAAIASLGTSRGERDYWRECEKRPKLDVREFYDAYYAGTEISFDTCCRVLEVLRTQLNMFHVRPDDNVARIFEDVDFYEVCLEVCEEFDVQFPDTMIEQMDGTVDCLIRKVELLRKGCSDTGGGMSR